MNEEALKAHQLKEAEMIEKYGFVTHATFPSTPNACWNIHTHGITQFGHPDIQIYFPYAGVDKKAHELFTIMVKEIREGKKYRPGQIYSHILEGYDVTFVWAEESGRDVLRMILPDSDGELEQSKMEKPFDRQYEGTALH